ncbi:inner nuclear membrane protein enriched at telomere/subtelomere region [Entomortierella beljakovae]|nr:inner nuclear membrane protein enriched at telomere/subtelomere region [Entomortierella beljakovae]
MPKVPLPHYLHPDYDPTNDKIDRLRGILVHYNVEPPQGNVRRQDFVELFEKHIRPQIPTLRHYYENIVPSDEGIIKVPASAMVSLFDTKPESEEAKSTNSEAIKSLSSSTSSTMSSSSNSSSKRSGYQAGNSESGHGNARNEKTDKPKRKTASENRTRESSVESTRSKTRHGSISTRTGSDTDSISSYTLRRKRHTEKKKEKKTQDMNFSDDNPFQSGSESDRRRRTKSRDNSSSSRRSSRTRRKSYDRRNEGEANHSYKIDSSTSQPLFSDYMHASNYPTSAFDRLDLNDRSFPISPLVAKTRRISAAALASSKPQYNYGHISHFHGAAGGFRRHNETHHQRSYDKQPWDWIYPTCIPCPTHAICLGPHDKPVCPPEYILRPHPLNFGNLLPLTPECILNRDKEYQSLQVADVAEEILHSRAGIEECKTFSKSPRNSELFSRQSISICSLKSEIIAMKDSSVSMREFEQYWSLALSELYRRSDTITIDGKYMRSLKPSKPLVCYIRQGVASWFQQYQAHLSAIILISICGLLIRRQISKRREEEKNVQDLVDNVLSKLADQSHYHYIDPVLCLDPFLPQIHLRDVLLRDMESVAKRQEIWEKVSALVDRNSSVRVSAQEVQGEIHRVWEWVGATGVLSRKAMRGIGNGNGIHSSPLKDKSSPMSSLLDNDSLYGVDDSDLELVNPARSLYPSLLQD